MSQSSRSVVVREVGPRDGLQSVSTQLSTADKLRWISAMADAGVIDIEIASFVPPALLPQMADGSEVTRSVRRSLPGVRVAVLAPNFRGAQDAVAAGAPHIVFPVSASEAHSVANVRRSTSDQVAAVARVVSWARGLPEPLVIEAGVATAFGCSLQGSVREADVIRIAVALVQAGADVVSFADTLGYATPSHVRRLVRAVLAEIGMERFGGLHLHDTLGMALANVVAGLDEGVRRFDASLRGLGGCPYAPGSAGNLATEDLVYLLESEGLPTGIDLDKLIRAGQLLRGLLPSEQLRGSLSQAGVPRTYVPARPEPV